MAPGASAGPDRAAMRVGGGDDCAARVVKGRAVSLAWRFEPPAVVARPTVGQ
jgi:hypothetical protein